MKIVLFLICLILSMEIMGQERRDRLVKFGGMAHYNTSNIPGLNMGYNAGFEFERAYGKMEFLSHSFRFDLNYMPFVQEQFNYFGYNFKFYPLYWSYRRKPLRGFFIGAGPSVFNQNLSYRVSRFGPGMNVTAGYQVFINDWLSVVYEMDMHYLKNRNFEYPWHNPDNHWYTFFYHIKLGVRF